MAKTFTVTLDEYELKRTMQMVDYYSEEKINHGLFDFANRLRRIVEGEAHEGGVNKRLTYVAMKGRRGDKTMVILDRETLGHIYEVQDKRVAANVRYRFISATSNRERIESTNPKLLREKIVAWASARTTPVFVDPRDRPKPDKDASDDLL